MLNALQQVVGLEVCVAIVGRLNLASPAQQRIAFVQQQDDVERLGAGQDTVQILLGFTDVLVHHGCEVDAIDIDTKLRRENLCG